MVWRKELGLGLETHFSSPWTTPITGTLRWQKKGMAVDQPFQFTTLDGLDSHLWPRCHITWDEIVTARCSLPMRTTARPNDTTSPLLAKDLLVEPPIHPLSGKDDSTFGVSPRSCAE